VYLHDCTMVTPFPLLFFGGDITTSRVRVHACMRACLHVCVMYVCVLNTVDVHFVNYGTVVILHEQ